MPVKSVSILKTFFETGDRPTESQFVDLIDSFLHKATGAVVTAKDYNAATGDVSITFSDSSTLAFNVAGNANEDISFINGLQDALNDKVSLIAGQGLSENNFTNELRTKLENLTQVELPTEAEISFINGLQLALNEKANDDEVVKTVNNVAPDAAGNVNVATTAPYDLTDAPSWLNKLYFNKNVFGVLIEIPAPTPTSTEYPIVHNLDVDKYLKLELVNDGIPKTPNAFVTNEGRIDLLKLVTDNAGTLTLDNDTIDIAGISIPATGVYVYVEFTTNDPVIEGIASDAVGAGAIGQD